MQQPGDRFRRRGVAEREVAQHDDVFRRRQHLADARLPVAPGPADLLGVILQALGHVVVVDVADVGLIDAHAEGNCSNDNRVHDWPALRPIAGGRHEPVLCGMAVLVLHPGVIRPCGQARRLQLPGDVFGRALAASHKPPPARAGAEPQPVQEQFVAV